jgi:hypothetical protein
MSAIDFYVKRNDAFHAQLYEMVAMEDNDEVSARLELDEREIPSILAADSAGAQAAKAAIECFRDDFLPEAKRKRKLKLQEQARRAAEPAGASVGGKKKGKKGKGKGATPTNANDP